VKWFLLWFISWPMSYYTCHWVIYILTALKDNDEVCVVQGRIRTKFVTILGRFLLPPRSEVQSVTNDCVFCCCPSFIRWKEEKEANKFDWNQSITTRKRDLSSPQKGKSISLDCWMWRTTQPLIEQSLWVIKSHSIMLYVD